MSVRKYKDSETVDFAIVGSGASGGVIARQLAQAGLSVVLLEQGPRLSPADFDHDELKHWYLGGIANDAVRNPQTFRDDPARKAELQKVRPALWYGRAVGGASLHYTANYWRFHEIDFIERSVLGAIDGTGFADWPITYADLERYYTQVEWEIGVSGLAGASPFDPPRAKPYPMPPLPVKSSGMLLERGARKLGLHPFPAPMAINSQPGGPISSQPRHPESLHMRRQQPGDVRSGPANDDHSGARIPRRRPYRAICQARRDLKCADAQAGVSVVLGRDRAVDARSLAPRVEHRSLREHWPDVHYRETNFRLRRAAVGRRAARALGPR